MKLILLVATVWSIALCEQIVSEASHIQLYSTDADDHGDIDDQDFEEDGYNLHKRDHGGHVGSHYGNSGEVDNHGQRYHAQHSAGSHSSLGSSGGHHGNVQKYHDRGHYQREKKYGYEKAYGYDRVTKHHDKAGVAQSYGANHRQHSQHDQHKQGAQSGQSQAHHANHHNYGSQNKGQYGRLVNVNDYHKRVRDHHNRRPAYRKYISYRTPMHQYGGFSSGIGGGIGGLRGGYGYGGAGRFPLYQRHFGNDMGSNALRQYRNYGEGYDQDYDLDGYNNDVSIPYSAYGHMQRAGRPMGLSGLGGGLGPNGYQYFVRQHSHSYRN